MEISASGFKPRANAPEGRKAISYQTPEAPQDTDRVFVPEYSSFRL